MKAGSPTLAPAESAVSPGLRNTELVLLPARVSIRRLPVNFEEHDRRLFAHELVKEIPETTLRELRDVHASADGFLFKRGKILTESFAFPFLFDAWRRRRRLKFLANNYIVKRRKRFERNAAWIVDEWSCAYYHWLADALTRLFVMRDRLDDHVVILPHHYEKLDFVQQSLKAFAVSAVEFMNRDEALLFENLVLATPVAPSGHFREEIILGVREVLLNSLGDSSNRARDRRIYVSRRSARKRRIVNEEEVIRLLLGFGFEIVVPEGYSFERQVKLFSYATRLVSNHGAGLTNMLFMNPGSRVLELRHVDDRVDNCYFTLANALDLAYYYQTCSPANAKEDPHTADLLVDTDILEKNVKLILES